MCSALALPSIDADASSRRRETRTHRGDVATGAKPLAATGNHDSADVLRPVCPVQHLDQIGPHVIVHGVSLVGPVQGNHGNAVAKVCFDQLCFWTAGRCCIRSHGCLPFRV